MYKMHSKMLATFLLAMLAVYVYGDECPLGWKRKDKSCYSIGTETVTWVDAQVYCSLYGGHLVEVNDPAENEHVVSMLRSEGIVTAWTGATERTHRGTWKWIPSGHDFTRFSNWFGTEPSGIEEDCMTIDKGFSYRWNDQSCMLSYNFICEKSANTGSK